MKTKLITYALPYANGSLHMGHMMGLIQADCYARFCRMTGHPVVFVCGDDAHGTPIMLKAQKLGVTPDSMVREMQKEHHGNLSQFHISVDGYYSTHDEMNTQVVHEVYKRLQNADFIVTKEIRQAYDDQKNMFLPDRFIKGVCPKCGAEDQYGDHCEQCGKTYAISELKNPVSIISDTEPVWRPSQHEFFKLSMAQPDVSAWLHHADVQESVCNKLTEWFDDGLQDWDISRDAPYFGVEIPGKQNKYFYVWLDAPFGYVSFLGMALNMNEPKQVIEAWNKCDIIHFIGKDITYFHGIFWPAVLKASGLKQPDKLHVHGFLTLSGHKMSKSRGRLVSLEDYLSVGSADMLRYYFASRLSSGVVDTDLDWQDFKQKINSDLVGKLVNIGSRSQGFIHKYFSGQLAGSVHSDVWQQTLSKHDEIIAAYDEVYFAKVCRLVMELCDEVNQYIDAEKPWILAKEGQLDRLAEVATTSINCFRYLVYLLSPILPELSAKVLEVFADQKVDMSKEPLLNLKIEQFGHLISRVTDDQLSKVISE